MSDREELIRQLDSLKSREQKRKKEAQLEGEKMMGTIFSLAGAAGGGFLVGSLAKKVKESDDFKNADADKQQEMLEEATGVSGIDFDAILGGILTVAGIADWFGEFSEPSRQLGIGLVDGYLGRVVYAKTSQPSEENA